MLKAFHMAIKNILLVLFWENLPHFCLHIFVIEYFQMSYMNKADI